MKKIILLIATMAISALSMNAQFLFDANGIGPVKYNMDFRDLPSEYAGLYDRAEFMVYCGSEDGDGVAIVFYMGDKEVVSADLDMPDELTEAMMESDLACENFPFAENKLYRFLVKNGATKIGYISVTADANAKIKISGKEYSVATPAKKFALIPGAKAEAWGGEGMWINMAIGKLNINASNSLTPSAYNRIEAAVFRNIERGSGKPVIVKATDFSTTAKAERFSYSLY